jgi:hypothetical protein
MKYLIEGNKMATEIDMKGKKCGKCKKGTYQETSQMDDMDGVLHCDKCGSETKRHKSQAKESITVKIDKYLLNEMDRTEDNQMREPVDAAPVKGDRGKSKEKKIKELEDQIKGWKERIKTWEKKIQELKAKK